MINKYLVHRFHIKFANPPRRQTDLYRLQHGRRISGRYGQHIIKNVKQSTITYSNSRDFDEEDLTYIEVKIV